MSDLFVSHCRYFLVGNPTGKGIGGQSIWGENFEDEFHPKLRHNKPYMVSMAKTGPNTSDLNFSLQLFLQIG
uniref:peptidylprolyl isomerase n=1 Tax=Brugia malayi TaxID=6279 RepID=A0A1I9G0E6_BRUMA|nr:Bm14747 [Brugia malayi]